MPLSYLAHSRALVINFDPRGANSNIIKSPAAAIQAAAAAIGFNRERTDDQCHRHC